jgi:K+ transporter
MLITYFFQTKPGTITYSQCISNTADTALLEFYKKNKKLHPERDIIIMNTVEFPAEQYDELSKLC